MLRKCTSYTDEAGRVQPLGPEIRRELEDMITEMASTGLRTLCLTYADISADANLDFEAPPDVDLIACCIVGIKVGGALPLACCSSPTVGAAWMWPFWW